MLPRILNLQARSPWPLEACEPCAPDVHYFPVDDPHSTIRTPQSFVAFDANTLVAMEISKAQYEALTTPRESPVKPGEPPAAGEQPPPALMFSRLRPKFALDQDVSCRQLTLHLSDQCNQKCSYCWIRKSEVGSQRSETRNDAAVMTREIAAAALEMFPAGRDIRVGFFGGEPLLHFALLAAITETAEQVAERNKARAFFHVTTNAALVTPMVAQFLAKHEFSIIVSCDGPEKLHDGARGAGSHFAMLRGLTRLELADCAERIVLRGTWTGSPAKIVERLDALNWLAKIGAAAGVALEPVAGAVFDDSLRDEIHAACAWFRDCALAGGTPRWQYLEKTLRRILWQQFRPSECGAGRGYYAVGPTGLIYACHKQQGAEIGRLVDGQPLIDQSKRAKWLDNRFCARRECGLCWARHVCGGACRSESVEFCDSIATPHAGRCMLMRQIVAEALVIAAALPREALLRICPATAKTSPHA